MECMKLGGCKVGQATTSGTKSDQKYFVLRRSPDAAVLKGITMKCHICRKEMGCSQETLAAMLYMKKTTICRYEKDERDIPVSVIVELAKALQTTPNDLLMKR